MHPCIVREGIGTPEDVPGDVPVGFPVIETHTGASKNVVTIAILPGEASPEDGLVDSRSLHDPELERGVSGLVKQELVIELNIVGGVPAREGECSIDVVYEPVAVIIEAVHNFGSRGIYRRIVVIAVIQTGTESITVAVEAIVDDIIAVVVNAVARLGARETWDSVAKRGVLIRGAYDVALPRAGAHTTRASDPDAKDLVDRAIAIVVYTIA